MLIQKIPIKFILLWWLVTTWLVLVPRAMRAEEVTSDHVLVPCHISHNEVTPTTSAEVSSNTATLQNTPESAEVAPAPQAIEITPRVTSSEPAPEPAPEPTPAPLTFPAHAIRITEIYPSPPTGSSEWVELWNATSQVINLEGWQLKDASGALTDLTGTVEAAGYFLVSDPKGHLNNSGDSVTLFDPAGTEIDDVSYPNIKRGESYARDGETWLETNTPTPLGPNVVVTVTPAAAAALPEPIPEASESLEAAALPRTTVHAAPSATHIASLLIPQVEVTPGPKLKTETKLIEDRKPKTKSRTKKSSQIHDVSLEEARELEKGMLVRTRGLVSVAPGIIGSRTMYLAGSGMQVYLHGMDVPQLAAGDVVELTGKLGSVGGETRLVVSKPDALRVIEHREVPTPEVIEIGEIGDATEGWLVLVEGIMTEKLNGRFILEDASGSVPVVIKTNTGVDQRTVGVGDTVRVTGIVSETQSGFRLLPRGEADLQVLAEAVATDRPKPRLYISPLTILAGAFASILIFMIARKTIVNRKSTPAAPAPVSG